MVLTYPQKAQLRMVTKFNIYKIIVCKCENLFYTVAYNGWKGRFNVTAENMYKGKLQHSSGYSNEKIHVSVNSSKAIVLLRNKVLKFNKFNAI